MQFRWLCVLAVSGTLVGCGRAPSDAGAEAPTAGKVSGNADLAPVTPGTDDWPWWRGPNLDNVAGTSQHPPVRWSETENVIWKIDVLSIGYLI